MLFFFPRHDMQQAITMKLFFTCVTFTFFTYFCTSEITEEEKLPLQLQPVILFPSLQTPIQLFSS